MSEDSIGNRLSKVCEPAGRISELLYYSCWLIDGSGGNWRSYMDSGISIARRSD